MLLWIYVKLFDHNKAEKQKYGHMVWIYSWHIVSRSSLIFLYFSLWSEVFTDDSLTICQTADVLYIHTAFHVLAKQQYRLKGCEFEVKGHSHKVVTLMEAVFFCVSGEAVSETRRLKWRITAEALNKDESNVWWQIRRQSSDKLNILNTVIRLRDQSRCWHCEHLSSIDHWNQ